jgi:hypothetical protein
VEKVGVAQLPIDAARAAGVDKMASALCPRWIGWRWQVEQRSQAAREQGTRREAVPGRETSGVESSAGIAG